METRDVGKVLMHLKEPYYEKGMSKISVIVKGIRKEKIANTDRKIVIPQLIRSKENEKFIKQFLENLKEELDILSENEYVKKIVENPKGNLTLREKCEKELLYLYLISLHNEKYNEILEILVKEIGDKQNNDEIETKEYNNINRELEKYKKMCEDYIEEIARLKELSKQRKEKIKELEISNNILNEENSKLSKENNVLMIQVEEMMQRQAEMTQVLDVASNILDCDERKNQEIIAIIENEKTLNINDDNVKEILVRDYLAESNETEVFKEILVYKRNMQISKLRKIKKVSEDKAKFFETREEILEYLYMMEEKNENRVY